MKTGIITLRINSKDKEDFQDICEADSQRGMSEVLLDYIKRVIRERKII